MSQLHGSVVSPLYFAGFGHQNLCEHQRGLCFVTSSHVSEASSVSSMQMKLVYVAKCRSENKAVVKPLDGI